MIARKAFQYRLNPTKKQLRLLELCLNECRWLYNELLSERKVAFEELEISLTKYQQLMFLPALKLERPELDQVHSQVFQNVVDRLDKAFQGFFRRCKAGEKPGFPRFRGMHRYNSFCYPQSGFAVVGKELKLSKIGNIRIKMHRHIEGEIKTCTLRRNPSGNWDVSFSCEVKIDPQFLQEGAVGIDVGLQHFAVLPDGKEIQIPDFSNKEKKNLPKPKENLAKMEKGSKERRNKAKLLQKFMKRSAIKERIFATKNLEKLSININTFV